MEDNRIPIEGLENSYQQALRELGQHHTDVAISTLTELAHSGYRKAMLMLGRIYYKGKGVDFDTDMAIHWFSQAAELGSYAACRNLGNIYYDMGDTDENNRLAWKYYYLAANMRDKAHFYIGKMIVENRIRNIETIWDGCLPNDDVRIEIGITYYEDALADKYPLAGLYMWKTYKMYGLSDAAEEFYQQGEQLMETPADFNNWAYTLCEWGEHAKALPYIEKCMDIAGEDNLCTYMLDTYAEVLYGLGRLEESKQTFNRCLQLATDMDERRRIHETTEKIRMKFCQS